MTPALPSPTLPSPTPPSPTGLGSTALSLPPQRLGVLRRALPLAPVLALLLGACSGQNTEGSKGTTTAGDIPANQGIGGANDGAPGTMGGTPGAIAGGKEAATAHPGNAGEGNPAGAQNYPATGAP